MIIATAIGELVKGMLVDVVDQGLSIPKFKTHYHYGDQGELLHWIKVKGNTTKYPLIWYVLNDYKIEGEWYVVQAKVVIMQNTKPDPLNPWRQSNSYVGIINPVTKAFEEAMVNTFVIIEPYGYSYKDEPNYGVTSPTDLQGQVSTESISSDIVDARVIRFDLRIMAECLID